MQKSPVVVLLLVWGLGSGAGAHPTTVTDGFTVATGGELGCPPPTVLGATCELAVTDPDFVKQCCVAPPSEAGPGAGEVVAFETSVTTTTAKGLLPLIATLSSVAKEAVVTFVSADGRVVVGKERLVHATADHGVNYGRDLGSLQKRYTALCGGKRPCALKIRVHRLR